MIATRPRVAHMICSESHARRPSSGGSGTARFIARALVIAAFIGAAGFATTPARADPLPSFRDAFKDKSARRGPEMVALPGGAVRLGEPDHEVVLSSFAMA